MIRGGFGILWVENQNNMGRGFKIPWVEVRNTMGREFDKPQVGGTIHHGKG
jgi:hypothetical protein